MLNLDPRTVAWLRLDAHFTQSEADAVAFDVTEAIARAITATPGITDIELEIVMMDIINYVVARRIERGTSITRWN